MKLLLVEDEREIASAVAKVLRHNNYLVDVVYDGEEALDYLACAEYDAVILDVMMPKLDGVSVAKELRKNGNNVPILMLTAKAEIDDRVLGLDVGADDYLTKPFAMKELLARIRSVTRRKDTSIKEYVFADISLNPQNYELSTSYKKCRLSSKEFQMLELLMNNANVLISTERFMEKVWGFDTEAEINVVWVYISAIRKKLDFISANVTIKAVRGLGYQLENKHD